MSISIEQQEMHHFLMVGDKVLIKPKDPQSQTKAGLLLPPSVQKGERLQRGYVVRVGPGLPLPMQPERDELWKKQEGEVDYLPLQAKEGDLALYLQSSGYEIEIDEEVYLIIPHSAILMLVRDKALFE